MHTPAELRSTLTDRLRAVRERIAAACRRVGRDPAGVRLVAVTKTVGPAVAGLLPELGVNDLGESRPQELWRKAAALPPNVRWHLVGHLQRNKVERTLPLVQMIHSVDSLRLLDALEVEAAKRGVEVPALLEMNVSREVAKHGFAPEDVPGLAERLRALRRVQVRGLMAMAAFTDDPEGARPAFAELRALRDLLRADLGPGFALDELSMGMSHDYEVAVEEGATIVRLGTTLFEGLEGEG
jgi:pyridoxal phosphate enzyme (YggS family)